MCDNCDWADLISDIDELLDDGDFNFAESTLSGIRDWVEENEHCTEGQKAAVENIGNSRDRLCR